MNRSCLALANAILIFTMGFIASTTRASVLARDFAAMREAIGSA
jgi:hypothetical protein